MAVGKHLVGRGCLYFLTKGSSTAFPHNTLRGEETSCHPLLQCSGGHEYNGVQPIILHDFPSSLPPTGVHGSPFNLRGPWESLLTTLQLCVLHSSH